MIRINIEQKSIKNIGTMRDALAAVRCELFDGAVTLFIEVPPEHLVQAAEIITRHLVCATCGKRVVHPGLRDCLACDQYREEARMNVL